MYANTTGLDVTGKEAAKRHTKYANEFYDENVQALHSIIDFAAKYKLKVILFTPPAYHTYVENLDKTQLNRVLNVAADLSTQNKQVRYFNFMSDTAFTQEDFYDADHLNASGATKLSLKINEIIKNDTLR